MGKQRITFEFQGLPVAYVRMNSQNIWTERVQNYLAYKNALTTAITAAFPHLRGLIPSNQDKKAYSAYTRDHRFQLHVKAYLPRRGKDWDNLGKPVTDALQAAQILIANDEQIDDGRVQKFIDRENPRVWFELEEM